MLSCIEDARAHCLSVEFVRLQPKLAERQITIYREWLTISVTHSWADCISQSHAGKWDKTNAPTSLHSAVVAGNGSNRRIQLHRISGYSVGHWICMHMGIGMVGIWDGKSFVGDMFFFKYPGRKCISAISVEEHNAKSPKQNASAFKRASIIKHPGMSDIWCEKNDLPACNVLIGKECSSRAALSPLSESPFVSWLRLKWAHMHAKIAV